MAKVKKQSALIGVFVVALLAGFWKFLWQPAEAPEATLSENPSTATNIEESAPLAQPAPGKAVTSEAPSEQKQVSVKTKYNNPGGSDEVGFSLTVNKEGVITAAMTEVLAKNPTSIKRQEAFAKDFPRALQGKKLSELTAIDKVGGSSLTTASFNASLAELKAGF